MHDPRPGLYIGSSSHQVEGPREAVEYFTDPLVRSKTEDAGPIKVPAIPAGETSDPHWVDKQLEQFDNVGTFRKLKPSTFGRTERYWGMPVYVARRGRVADVNEINLLFEERAREEHPIWKQACDEQGLKDQRFQVGINTIDLLIFALRKGADKQLDPYIEKTRRETAAIWELTGGKAFFLIETPTATILSNLTRPGVKKSSWRGTPTRLSA